MSDPHLMLFGEPSLGVSPAIVGQILDVLRQLVDEGRAVVMLEQNVGHALREADRGLHDALGAGDPRGVGGGDARSGPLVGPVLMGPAF